VLIVSPVLETTDVGEFGFWPVAGVAPCRFVPVSGGMSGLWVGSAVAMLAGYNARVDDGEGVPGDGEALVRRLAEAETVLAPGGLRFHDTATGVTVEPGCCCGLEDWREWYDVIDGETLWLGHDPAPRFEHGGDVVRLWPDGRDAAEAPEGPAVEVVVAELPAVLRGVQEELRGFLRGVGEWAGSRFPGVGEGLVARLGEGLGVRG
jgi:hypothetical protein